MCGRYTQKATADELVAALQLDAADARLVRPTYNAAPTQSLPVVPNARDGSRALALFRWGLVPPWAKDHRIGSRMINARAETLRDKPSFRAAFKYRRCLVPTTGFYEWLHEGAGRPKRPMLIQRRDQSPFAFAGLWERKEMPDGTLLHTFTIITTTPNAMMAKLHRRMPVILPPRHWARWLDVAQTDTTSLQSLLVPLPEGALMAWEVGSRVNKAQNNDAQLVEPVDGGLRLS